MGSQAPLCYRLISVRDYAALRGQGHAPRLVDIREPFERHGAVILDADCLPLSELREWWPALDPGEPVVFHCQTGSRSGALCCALAAVGFAALWSLVGGVDAWVAERGQEPAPPERPVSGHGLARGKPA